MSDVPQNTRNEAAKLARRKSARDTKFTREAPCEWNPQTVQNQKSGGMFTPDSAWEFVAEKLEDEKQKAQWVELRKPLGKKAIVLVVASNGEAIYIKVQLGAGKIIGRSFHYSDRQRNQSS